MVKISVRVKPGSSKGPLVETEDGVLVVYPRQRAVDRAANEALIQVIAAHYGVAKSRVQITSGQAARIKRLSVEL